MVNDLQARLHSLYGARQPVGGVHGQTVGQERYKLIASGEQLYTLLEAADRIAELEARCSELQASLEKYQACRVHDVDEKSWLSKRVTELEALLGSIRGYMIPGNVMPVPEQAKYIVQWIDAALGSTPSGEVKPRR